MLLGIESARLHTCHYNNFLCSSNDHCQNTDLISDCLKANIFLCYYISFSLFPIIFLEKAVYTCLTHTRFWSLSHLAAILGPHHWVKIILPMSWKNYLPWNLTESFQLWVQLHPRQHFFLLLSLWHSHFPDFPPTFWVIPTWLPLLIAIPP